LELHNIMVILTLLLSVWGLDVNKNSMKNERNGYEMFSSL